MTTDKTSQNELYGYSFDQEVFHGKYASREEAASAAISENDAEAGAKFWTGKNDDPPHASAFIQDADDLLDYMAQRAYDEYDEQADDWPGDYTPEQRTEVDRLLGNLADYIQSIDPPKFYLIGEVQEHVVPGESA